MQQNTEQECGRILTPRDKYESFRPRKCHRQVAPGETACTIHLAADKRSAAQIKAANERYKQQVAMWQAEREVKNLLGNGTWPEMLVCLQDILRRSQQSSDRQ